MLDYKINVRLPIRTVSRIDTLTKQRKCKRSQIMREVVDFCIAGHEHNPAIAIKPVSKTSSKPS